MNFLSINWQSNNSARWLAIERVRWESLVKFRNKTTSQDLNFIQPGHVCILNVHYSCEWNRSYNNAVRWWDFAMHLQSSVVRFQRTIRRASDFYREAQLRSIPLHNNALCAFNTNNPDGFRSFLEANDCLVNNKNAHNVNINKRAFLVLELLQTEQQHL